MSAVVAEVVMVPGAVAMMVICPENIVSGSRAGYVARSGRSAQEIY